MPQTLQQRVEKGRETIGVIVPWTLPQERPGDDRLSETAGLALALDCELSFIRSENVRKPSAAYLLSGGLLQRLEDDVRTRGCDIVVIDAALTPIQQRNLETRLKTKVIDRTGLILEIFGLRARTKEGRLQVELARLGYERSRLVRTWTHLERQRGGRGFLGGPGETQIEADKRMIDRALQSLKRDLEQVKRTRAVQRAGRRRGERPIVALVGYTNAGKSTLFNALTGAKVFAKDMPFATLDPTIRQMELSGYGPVSLIDTVGFITDLPTHLIESFRATLEETLDADLLLHVRDRSSAADEVQKTDVLTVLEQLSEGANRPLPPMVEVWNKIDCLAPEARLALENSAIMQAEPPILVSAASGEGLETLQARLLADLKAGGQTFAVQLPGTAGRARSWLHQYGDVEQEMVLEDGGVSLEV
ncbi:MAG: GTPase HflX, partial [Pseudomonadota bacterium]